NWIEKIRGVEVRYNFTIDCIGALTALTRITYLDQIFNATLIWLYRWPSDESLTPWIGKHFEDFVACGEGPIVRPLNKCRWTTVGVAVPAAPFRYAIAKGRNPVINRNVL